MFINHTPKEAQQNVSMARRPTQKETLRRKKKNLQNETKIRKRLIPNPNHPRRNKKENNTQIRSQHKNPPHKHKPSQHIRPKNWKNPKNPNHTSHTKPSQRRLQPKRRHNQRHNHRNTTRNSQTNIKTRTTRHRKRRINTQGNSVTAPA